ncbi:acyltransferase family protein [Enterobacter sp. C4G1]|uniref:acyltransferase family protein n=1 Tax=Enterobacter sp. C4G1 TaxID=3458724 RepID=UPI004068835D
MSLSIVLTVCVGIVFSFAMRNFSGEYFKKELNGNGRFDTLDGLRGLAAILVAIHHSFFFYWYAKHGEWSINYIGGGRLQVLVDYLGKGSVSIFFMITSFLFWGKILCRVDTIDWREFYIKRFFRIVPLYIVVVLFSIFYVMLTVKTPFDIYPYIRVSFYWLTFDFFGTPNINGFPLSKSIVAGVFWSLSYEWMFYFLIPAFSVFAVSKKSSMFIVCMMLAILAFIYGVNIEIGLWPQIHVLCFIIGAACAHIYKFYPGFIKKLKSPVFSVIAVAALGVCIYLFDTPYSHVPTILIGIAFMIISSGNSILGFLKTRSMKILGTISYSVYLLHGIIYTVLFSPMIKSGVSFQVAIAITIPAILALSTASYLFIERKFMLKERLTTERNLVNSL